jgi:hypothetical protein
MPIEPKGTVNRHKGFSPGLTQFFQVNEWSIAAWCPDLKAEHPPTQVHLILDIEGSKAQTLLRFKGPDTLGFLIEELARYRREVWPDAAPVDTSGGWPEDCPVTVCPCGSTRFWRTFQEASLKETLEGKIVLSIGAASGTDDDHFGNLPREEYDRVKEMLDELHLRKIERADEVLILNVGGYIGESTGRELTYARKLGKRVRFWEAEQ